MKVKITSENHGSPFLFLRSTVWPPLLYAIGSQRGRWRALGGAKANQRPLTKIKIYRKLEQNIPKYHNFFLNLITKLLFSPF